MTRPAHHHPKRGFRNPWPSARRDGPSGGFLRWMLERRRCSPQPDPAPSALPRVASPVLPRELGPAVIAATWLGHSTVLIQAGGVTLLTDPVWAERASPLPFAGPRRWVPPPIAIDSLPPIDIVLQSHNHYDHFDHAATRLLARRFPEATWCVPLGLAEPARRLGVRLVRELDWDQGVDIPSRGGSLRVTAVPAQHFSARGLHDRDRTLWTGFVVRTPSGSVYFAGDTGLHPEFGRIAADHGPFDLAILPIGA
jgi:L-ascorbate metabolism protein UlaG (beta-lactamase superfamily)